MPEKTDHALGEPCWADLATPDLDTAERFYGALFDWELPKTEQSEQFGGYRQALKSGRPVAGAMTLMQEGQPPAWTTYFAVEDADAVTGLVGEAGGTVIAEPMDVGDLGRMAVFADPTGAVFGVWQAGSFAGAGLVGEHGAPTWSELGTRDVEAARAFYAEALDWRFEDREFELGAYTTISAEGDPFGGMLDITERVPAEVPAHWLVYFAVEDAEATVAAAKENGGEIPAGPFEVSEVGRIAVVEDPHGAFFAIIQPDPEMRADSDPGRR
jgi:predicted enzyme related to lactoylglutathione lyase